MWKLENDLCSVKMPYVAFHNPLETPKEDTSILMAFRDVDKYRIDYLITKFTHPFLSDERGYYQFFGNYYLPSSRLWLGWAYLSDFDNFVEQY